MIIDALIVHNVGLFRGRNALQLPEPTARQPVTVLRALNGSGKTTLLEALRLGLYGRRAPSLPVGRAYEAQLRAMIHHGVSQAEGAAIEVVFRLRSEGELRQYRVHRSWAAHGDAMLEKLKVYVDSIFDPSLTEGWAEIIEQWLPTRLSSFCFFDGEQLAALADPAQSQEVLRDAVRTLLGLDLVEQLGTDLKTLERRRRTQQLAPSEQAALVPLQAALETTEAQVQSTLYERAQRANIAERMRLALEQATVVLGLAGGDPTEARPRLLAEQGAASEHVAACEQTLRHQAYGIAPLLLVKGSLIALTSHEYDPLVSHPRAAKGLAMRDDWILTQIDMLGGSRALVQQLQSQLENERVTRASQVGADNAGQVSEVVSQLSIAEAQISADLASLERARERLDNVERALERLPREDDVASPQKVWEQALVENTRAKVELEQADVKLAQARRAREEAQARYHKALEVQLRAQQSQEEAELARIRSEQLRNTLDRFRATMTQRHASRLGDLISDCFAQLHRKHGLVHSVHIDPNTFAMTLFSEDGESQSAERLSAGERQLLAIATIWAIMRASGRPLPLVIDTPLGRLDSVHRHALLERFFVRASHQVVLLATDTELDAAAWKQLQPAIGCSYEINYVPSERRSQLLPVSLCMGGAA